ncbi:TIGR04222 domain-containing membrane protein [Actinosynnema sp. NPDC023658]|uniref:TIGR04222 domain-containing membrane protein n=1 Tax=Actinosynnema sp. NPDC023658 TaxID=3155465 RepID=UPI00340204B4
MATSWTPISAGSAGPEGSTPQPGQAEPEEQGFLVGGPGRAAEVAIVSLVEAQAVRISREGLVSAVSQSRPDSAARSPLQAHVLRSLPQSLGDVIAATASSAEAQSLGQHLVDRGLAVSPARRRAVRRLRRLVIAAGVATVFAKVLLDLPFAVAAVAVVGGLLVSLVLARANRPLTRSGRRVVRDLKRVAVSPNRLALVAYYGLLGKVGRHHVWEVLGIAPAAAATLRRRTRRSGSSDGSSCGGCGSCASSSCGSDSGSSSCGGSSCSSSSCGGGGCGGGGGD